MLKAHAALLSHTTQVELRDTLRPRIEAWCGGGKKDNIRALLASLHTVLWEGSGWTQASVADMVDPGKVKRLYMKVGPREWPAQRQRRRRWQH